ncbi:MAG: fumarylacetoacetate hydrolase family protein [Actinobacteria bacterium]|nr:fumarylacetoacetate hydrolase family protein [Actinomycetota bacterium]MBO0785640.1 fumarylacetoacetate hydrolase family protein [Actinomycetota bacterium]MBO0816674.1 fumarylacetoacetate hydrolase family protein [Actinomycetota bacterium]
MRIARFAVADDVAYGVVGTARANGAGQPGEPVVAEISGHPFGAGEAVKLTGASYPVADVRLLAPVLPSKVVAVGKNYAEHVREMAGDSPGGGTAGVGGAGGEPSAEPVLFLKPSTSVCGPGDPISYPVGLSSRVDYEGELAVVIGRLCREVPADQASRVIFGYTCANDVTARDLQARDGQWTRAKGFDTFCPLGPWIETEADPAALTLTTTVNGEVRQQASTSGLLHDVSALVAFASNVMTLLPGDVLLTGTPAGVGPLADGDEVAVTIEGIGTLTNKVISGD